MAIGDLVLTHHGVHNISGAALTTAIAGVNITEAERLSGAVLLLVPSAQGQVAVLEVTSTL